MLTTEPIIVSENSGLNLKIKIEDPPELIEYRAKLKAKQEQEERERESMEDDDDLFNDDDSSSNVEEPLPQEAQNQVIEDDDLFNNDASNIAETSLPQETQNQTNINENIQTVEQVPEKNENIINFTECLLPIDYKSINPVDINIAKNNFLVQANDMIMNGCIVTPTSDARKLFYLALAEVKRDDNIFRPLRTHARDLMDMGIFKEKSTKKIYTRAEKACEDLTTSKLYIKSGNGKWRELPLVGEVRYENGDIYIILNFYLHPYLLKVSGDFTKIIFNIMLELKSQDSMTLYSYLYAKYTKAISKNKNIDVYSFSATKEEIEDLFEGEYKANENKKNARKRYLNSRDFTHKLLGRSIKDINESGLLNVVMKTNRKNSRRETDNYIFTVSLGENFTTLKEIREQQNQERLEKKELQTEEKELKLINLFFYKRFGIKSYNKDAKTEEEGTIEKLRQKGVSLIQLKLAAIQLQAYLNSTSDCIWEQKAYQNNTTEAKTALRNPYKVLETIISKNRYAKKITQFDKATDYAELKRKGIHISQLSKFNGADYDLDLVKAYEESEQVASDVNILFENVLETLDTVPNPFWDSIKKEAL